MSTYEIYPMTRDEALMAGDWAAAEGWNPGMEDIDCFCAVDADDFIGGFLDGETIASISVIDYDDAFAFPGLYIVTSCHRAP